MESCDHADLDIASPLPWYAHHPTRKINRKIELFGGTHLTYNHSTYSLWYFTRLIICFRSENSKPTLPKNAQVMQCLTAVFRQVVYTTNSKDSVPHVGDGRPPIKKKHGKQRSSCWEVFGLQSFLVFKDCMTWYQQRLSKKKQKKTIWNAHKKNSRVYLLYQSLLSPACWDIAWL